MPTKQEQEPASREVAEVAPGVLRLQLPIDMPGLGHVNTYALLDEKGAALVDPGLPGSASWKALQRRLKAAGLGPEVIHTVVVTHSHPDHFGAAGRMAKESGAQLVTHESFELWWDRPGASWTSPTPWGGKAFRPGLRRRVMYLFMRHGHVWAPPVPSMRVVDGDGLTIGDRRWLGVHTPGHTVDHLCLHDPDNGVLLSGDHVLPTITPHISGAGTAEDPLADFFESLERVASLDVRLVLPAHGHPFTDLAKRCKAIHDHHLERLERLTHAAEAHGGATVEELSHELFRERHWGFMAESETFAHLEHLRLSGRAERVEAPDGVWRYRVT